MKQKIYTWHLVDERLLLSLGEPRIDLSNCIAGAYSNGLWQTLCCSSLCGVKLEMVYDYKGTMESAKLAATREIRRQLAAHGKRVEIRRVK